jgi:pyoverdine/dityrosine biosynthesis protein Dit1
VEVKDLFSLHFHISIHPQKKSGLKLKQVRKQELMQRPWRDVTYWLASTDVLGFLSYRTQDHQLRDGNQGKGWNKKKGNLLGFFFLLSIVM